MEDVLNSKETFYLRKPPATLPTRWSLVGRAFVRVSEDSMMLFWLYDPSIKERGCDGDGAWVDCAVGCYKPSEGIVEPVSSARRSYRNLLDSKWCRVNAPKPKDPTLCVSCGRLPKQASSVNKEERNQCAWCNYATR